ncbi:MAG: DUF456 domain-containing protein [Planctomycetota bacterium]
MTYVWGFLLVVCLLAGWIVQLLGWPGNWLMVVAAAAYAWLVPSDQTGGIGWPVVVCCLVVATIGEVAELIAGALGVRGLGGSRRTATLAIVGSVVGSLVGLFIGLPIPVIGSVVAALVFAAVGAAVGALAGEYFDGRLSRQSIAVGVGALIARLLGTAGKLLGATVIAIILLVALLV